MIVYIENPTESTETATKTDFYKMRKYKVNIKISIVFLYNNNEQYQNHEIFRITCNKICTSITKKLQNTAERN